VDGLVPVMVSVASRSYPKYITRICVRLRPCRYCKSAIFARSHGSRRVGSQTQLEGHHHLTVSDAPALVLVQLDAVVTAMSRLLTVS